MQYLPWSNQQATPTSSIFLRLDNLAVIKYWKWIQINTALWKMIVQEKNSLAHFTFDNNSQEWDYCQQRKCRKFNKAPTLRIISKEYLTTKKGNFIEQYLNSVKGVWVWEWKMSCLSPYLNKGLFSQVCNSCDPGKGNATKQNGFEIELVK